jgi:hypothetical protein
MCSKIDVLFTLASVLCLCSQSSLNSGSTPNPRFEELAANKSRQKKGGGGAHSSDESLSDDVELAELDDEPVSIWIRIRMGNTDPDPDPGGPKWTTKVKKIKVLKC